jgi:hypothetical protein
MSTFSGQRGHLLLDVVVVLTVSLCLTVWASAQWTREARALAVQGFAQWLQQVSVAVGDVMSMPESGNAARWWQALEERPVQPIEAWLPWLSKQGVLTANLQTQPPLSRQVELVRLPVDPGCQAERCPRQVLLVAKPLGQRDEAWHEEEATHFLGSLPGEALAVMGLAPDWLKGAAFRVPNPSPGIERWPIGTFALLVWRSDLPPPYVRLNETRPVNFQGGLTVKGPFVVDGVLHASQGMILGQGSGTAPLMGQACQAPGLMMRSARAGLLICEFGYWFGVGDAPREMLPCAAPPQINPLVRLLWGSLFGAFDQSEPACLCPAGYLPRHVGVKPPFSHVVPREGHVCERH